MTALRGRPRIFVTLAEKQRAYRQRKKESEALRNSTTPVIEAIPSVQDELTRLWLEVERFAQEDRDQIAHHADMANLHFYASDEGYRHWLKIRAENNDQWWAAHQAWYAAWKVAGYPKGPWTKSK